MYNAKDMKKIAIIMGSDSDFPIVSEAIKTLKQLEIPFEARVLSAHRTPDEAAAFSKSAREEGFGVIIAAAGMAAHLAGVMAAHTSLPVIGLPIKSGALAGVDALYATVMMPPGVPVATVGIDSAKNAALLAAQVLAVSDDCLFRKLEDQKHNMAVKIAEKNQNLQSEINKL